jgi:hypothetical protein
MRDAQPVFIRDMARYGSYAAILLGALTLLWIATLGLAPVPPDGASASERLQFIAEHEGWHTLTFAAVVPLGLAHVPVWIGLAAVIWPRRPAMASMAAAFGLLYSPFTVLGYWSQLTTVRGLVALAGTEPERAAAAFEVIGFTGDLWSLSYGIVVMGYGLWGLAALAVFGGLRDTEHRLTRVVAVLFGVSGALGVIGAAGFAAQIPALELGVLLSGVVFFPAIIGTAVLLRQIANRTDGIIP